ncbi:tetratricopeptide repeat-containing sulfotransferase family protein [Thalassomonas haliotis]|uniref:Sulfotransferase n=1 Tax=Thalassomonas haliotis TaxID=485448 RepID=A0ABY7VI85_9GAMM|nr:sulfotransferase [Thalassomonas haliotis]WDE13276.1 sulfotransferase [Thalassomonas haliotis]
MNDTDMTKLMAAANTAFNCGRYNQAFAMLKKINNKQSLKNFNSVELQAKSLYNMDKPKRALTVYTDLLSLADNRKRRKTTWESIGKIHVELKNHPAAITAFQNCILEDDTISNAKNILLLCKLYRKNDNYQESEKLANKLLNWSDYFASALHQLILIAKNQNDKALILSRTHKLASHYRQLSPFYIYYSIQTFLALDATTEGRTLLSKAKILHGTPPWTVRLEAEFFFHDKQYPDVIRLLSDQLIKNLPSWIYKSLVFQLRGSANEKLKNYQQAFSDFSAMAKLVKAQVKHVNVQDDVEKYRKLNITSLPKSNEFQPKFQSVFMIGFPRSGTTLLDMILATQSEVVTLSETGAITAVILAFQEKLKKQYPQALTKLSNDEISLLRKVYYDYVAQLPQGEKINSDSIVIDKMPISTIHLPLILTLFPNARIIFSLRHPLDVCLSNFQQDYVLNQEMYYLIDFEDCIKRYRQVLSLFDDYQKNLKPDLIFIRYEDLVNDLYTEAERVFSFLNISQCDDYSLFHQQAKDKFIQTPSRNQVKQPLYKTSIYKWKNYQQNIEQYIPRVQEFIDRYGYNETSL